MTTAEKAVQWALNIAKDDSHGYDQEHRWGPDYDCSSFVISAYKAAGVPLSCTYTGNMKEDMLRHGFVTVPPPWPQNLKPGDVLLNERSHTAMYIGNGQIVQARINENGGITGGKSGDQNGAEIRVQSYYNFPWDCALRYCAEDAQQVPTEAKDTDVPTKVEDNTRNTYTYSVRLPLLQRGSKGECVRSLQQLLIAKGYDCGVYGADGDFGTSTYLAVVKYQNAHHLTADGEVGGETWRYLLGR